MCAKIVYAPVFRMFTFLKKSRKGLAETGVFANFADVICKHSLLYIGSHVKTYALILLFTLSATLTATAAGIVGQSRVYGAQGNHPVTAAAKPDSSKSTSGEAIVRTAMQYLGVR